MQYTASELRLLGRQQRHAQDLRRQGVILRQQEAMLHQNETSGARQRVIPLPSNDGVQRDSFTDQQRPGTAIERDTANVQALLSTAIRAWVVKDDH